MYAGIPVSTSIMYLTIVEIWVMCDKSACHLFPDLRDYGPEVDIDQFQGLSLPLKAHMKRLFDVEDYVQTRQANAQENYPSIFRNFGATLSFTVRYFDVCKEMQERKKRIEKDPSAKRQEKFQELVDLKEQRQGLINDYNKGTCETQTVVVNGEGLSGHATKTFRTH